MTEWDERQLRINAAVATYPMFCRTALRFIIENCGEDGLDRYAALVDKMIEPLVGIDDEGPRRTNEIAADMIRSDIEEARRDPSYF